ncbi:hypothetical protein MTO96_023442 [Rhipicephalus appendiculatus]
MGLPADESTLPLLDPVGKAIGASVSLLTATPSLPTGVVDSTTPSPAGFDLPLAVQLPTTSQAEAVVVSGDATVATYDRARLPNLTLTVVHLVASLAALRTAAVFRVTWSPLTPSSEGLAPKASSSTSASTSSFEHWRLAILLCAFMALPEPLPGVQHRRNEHPAQTTVLAGHGVASDRGVRPQATPGGRLVPASRGTGCVDERARRPAVQPLGTGLRRRRSGGSRLLFHPGGGTAAPPPWSPCSWSRRGGDPGVFLARHWNPRDAVLLVGSSLAGCLLTLTMQWLLGRTSALTYQVLGHVKMCATLIACAIVFDEHLKPMQQVGVFLTLCGAVLYTAFKSRDQPASSASRAYHDHHNCNDAPIGSPSAGVK